ncbi:MAG TPA: hypothetical protein V6D07_10475 [Trichocoleus sp.]
MRSNKMIDLHESKANTFVQRCAPYAKASSGTRTDRKVAIAHPSTVN